MIQIRVLLRMLNAVPDYWVHEDENGTDIAAGSMALLNAADTTGYYSELLECTAVAGYEDGKTYSIYIEATVGGDKGAIAYTFKAVALSMQDLQDSITAAADALYVPTAQTLTKGTTIPDGGSDDYTDLAADDGTRWQIQLEVDNHDDIDMALTFSLGTGRVATSVLINGYYEAGGVRACQVYAYNYTTTTYDKLSSPGAATEMRNRSTDQDYEFALNSAHTKPTATVGEVKIQFTTDSAGSDEDDLFLDYVAVTGASTGGASPQTIASAVLGT